MSNSIFDRISSTGPTSPLGKQAAQLRRNLDDSFSIDKDSARVLYSSESASVSESMLGELATTMQGVEQAVASLESVFTTQAAREAAAVSTSGKRAAAMAAMLLGDGAGFAAHKPAVVASSESVKVIASNESVDRQTGVVAALEAFDQRNLRDTQVYSALFNMRAGNQDEFAEAFFPTVVVGADQIGYTVSLNIVQVQEDSKRDISGSLTSFGRRNIIHALRDSTILQNDTTRIVPVKRAESAANFSAGFSLPSVVIDGETIATGALAIGKTFDLTALSQTQAILNTGATDVSDSISPEIQLENVYLKVVDAGVTEYIRLRTRGLPLADFTSVPQGQYRVVRLNFDTSDLRLGGAVKQVNGTPSVNLAAIGTGDLSVRLGFSMNGRVNCDLGDTNVTASAVHVVSITNASGVKISLDDASVTALVTMLEAATIDSYDLYAFRTNSNRRQRGKLLNTEFYSQLYPVPLLAPITVPRPQAGPQRDEATDVAALLTATGVMTTNAAVKALLDAGDLLRDQSNNADAYGQAPHMLGIGFGPIHPFFFEDTIDLETAINSISSTDKASDIRAVLIDRMRAAISRAYRNTGIQPALNARAGGLAPKPSVVVGTDRQLANWLFKDGDPRSLGSEFNFRIVSTDDQRMDGKIILTFVNEESAKSGTPDPLSFGNMAWKPELVLSLPTHFSGANVIQTTVQPSFRHVVNLPMMIIFTVTNLDKVAGIRTPIVNIPQA